MGLRMPKHHAAQCEIRYASASIFQVLQRGLPRPSTLDLLPAPRSEEELARLSAKELAEELMAREMVSLLNFEAEKHPIKVSNKQLRPFLFYLPLSAWQ